MPTPLAAHATKEIPLHLQDMTVEEMWDHDLRWKWDSFAEYLLIEVLKIIGCTRRW